MYRVGKYVPKCTVAYSQGGRVKSSKIFAFKINEGALAKKGL